MKKENKKSDEFIGEYFTRLRIENRYTQEQISDILGINRSSYAKYEKGSRGLPFSVFKKLCKLYHLDFFETFKFLDKELEKKGLNMYE